MKIFAGICLFFIRILFLILTLLYRCTKTRSIRKLCTYTIIVAITSNFDDKNIPSVLPYLKNGFNKIFSETVNQNRIINELLTLEYGEVANMQRLQAAHALFTALEYTNDPVEIMNDNFKLLVRRAFLIFSPPPLSLSNTLLKSM